MSIRSLILVGAVLGLLMTSCASAPSEHGGLSVASPAPAVAFDDEAADGGHGIGHTLLFYIPNRVFDVFDIVRARVRVGPGIAVGVRATDVADVFLGSYASVWAGIPGPRGEAGIPWPFGVETKSGLEASVADATVEGGVGPGYGPLEFGLGLQALIVGVDVGVDPLELLDLPLGLLTIDIGDDDY